MTSNVIVRPMVKDDAVIVLQMVNDLMCYQNLPSTELSVEEFLNDGGLGEVANPCPLFRVLVAEDIGEIVGYVLYYFVYPTILGKMLYMEDIYVKSEHRGKKIGLALLKELAKVAAARNMPIKLEVLNWNKTSVEFYKSKGAKYLYTKDIEWDGYIIKADTCKSLAQS